MGQNYRCPIDDCVFETSTSERKPTLEGHPDCTGPECRKSFSGGKKAPKVAAADQTAARRSISFPPGPQRDDPNAPDPNAAPLTPPDPGQGW